MAVRPRFLVDENLSVVLPAVAHESGFEAVHVNHRGLSGQSDRAIMRVARAEGWTLVTNDVAEFRSRYRREPRHAGLVLFRPVVRRERQIALFRAVLSDLSVDPRIANAAIEVDLDGDAITLRRYELP